jgi:hypothetical protein
MKSLKFVSLIIRKRNIAIVPVPFIFPQKFVFPVSQYIFNIFFFLWVSRIKSNEKTLIKKEGKNYLSLSIKNL